MKFVKWIAPIYVFGIKIWLAIGSMERDTQHLETIDDHPTTTTETEISDPKLNREEQKNFLLFRNSHYAQVIE